MRRFRLGLAVGMMAGILAACATTIEKPCTNGGDPPRPAGSPPFQGTKQCTQMKDQSGNYVNHGRYVEWYPNHLRAIEGEYRAGRKHGKWSEWDDTGKLISEKFYQDGAEIPNPDNPLSPAGSAGAAAAAAQRAAEAARAASEVTPAASAGAAAAAAQTAIPTVAPASVASPIPTIH